jgi:hypothetical protein
MSNRVIVALSVLSGVLLVLAGMLFPLVVPLEPRPPLLTANLLAGRQMMSYVYVAAVVLSNLAFSPLLVLLTIRLYPKRPGPAIIAGSLLAFAILLETIAVLISLARWSWLIPVGAKGDPNVLLLFETFQVLWMALDLPGAFLFYVSGVIYAVVLWRMHPTAAMLLAASAGFFVAGGAVSIAYPAIGGALVAGSIVVYGIAYIALGQFIIELGKPEANRESAGMQVSAKPELSPKVRV